MSSPTVVDVLKCLTADADEVARILEQATIKLFGMQEKMHRLAVRENDLRRGN